MSGPNLYKGLADIFSGGKELYDKVYHALGGENYNHGTYRDDYACGGVDDGGPIDFNEFVNVSSIAEPFIEAYITRIKFRPKKNSIVLYMMLSNTGGRDAQITAFDVEYLNIYDAAGHLLWSDDVIFNNVRDCYVQAGCHISEVPFIIDDVNVPAYRGGTTTDWNYRIYWNKY